MRATTLAAGTDNRFRLVFLELEERSRIGDFRGVVNSVSIYEFTADARIRRVEVYLQMELPASG